MKSRHRVSQEILKVLATQLVESLEAGCSFWPLPEPPLYDPEFPPIHPLEARDVSEKGLALLNADRGMFDRHLMIVVDLIVPHRMNLMDDPFEVHEKWLLKRINILSERLLFAIATEWLAQSLDPIAPDTDRWWLAISLINGLCIHPYGQSVHQGYHLVESITLAQRPGTWHTQPESGPHNMEWNPHGMSTKNTSIELHEKGAKAAIWLLERLENGDENRRLLLIEWSRLLLERSELIEPLNINLLLERRCSDTSEEVASRVVACLTRLIENNKDSGLKCVSILHKRKELLVRRNMADVLTRLFRRIEWEAVPLLNAMLNDEDESVRAVAASTTGDLRFLDTEIWADKLVELSQHKCAAVRRNLVNSIRYYVEHYTDDERKLIPKLWSDGDEVVKTRLREMLLRIEETDSILFSNRLKDLQELETESLWPPLEARRPGRPHLWKKWLFEGEKLPPSPELEKNHISDFTEPNLPELEIALTTLDSIKNQNDSEE